MKRDFLDLSDLGADTLRALIPAAAKLKQKRRDPSARRLLPARTLGMIFEKASTRTRVSFEVGMFELGGHAVYLSPEGSQIGRGEPIRDTARVLGSYCDAILMRTFGRERLIELAKWSPVPVINGLTDQTHPCQLLADLLTVWERLGPSALEPGKLRYAWVGDGNNMAHSWIEAAGLLGLHLSLACPAGYDPDPERIERALREGHPSTKIEVVRKPAEAMRGASVVSTDVWASMGEEAQAKARARAFAGFCVDEALVELTADDSIVLHCLPAHRGEEITEGVIEGPRSAVFDQAENRLHAQKAALLWVLGEPLLG
ncbi:MAG: ornithine carbamoyltransferase [Polyangia bacterium]